jgi:hypothetical protein
LLCVMRAADDVFCAKTCNFDQQTGCDIDWTCWSLTNINTWGACLETL